MRVKRRSIFSFLLTAVVVLLTNSLWLKPFDWKLLLILLVLCFMLFYKLFDYVASFKTVENKSRIDIVFLFIFFVWLFVPMSYITDKDYSVL